MLLGILSGCKVGRNDGCLEGIRIGDEVGFVEGHPCGFNDG